MSKVSSTQISTVELTLEIYGYVKLAAFAAMCLDGTLKSCYNINKEGNDRRSLPIEVKVITALVGS